MPLFLAACGLADDERDYENRYIYIENQFSDPHFRAFCMEHYDLNRDGHVSRYEAQRILKMECPGLEIASMNGINEFIHLQRLDCSDNILTSLDLSKCTSLRELDCSDNALASLGIKRLISLITLDCSRNRLSDLQLPATRTLVRIDCARNELQTLDVSNCAQTMSQLDARSNPRLEVIYARVDQQFGELLIDGPTLVERR